MSGYTPLLVLLAVFGPSMSAGLPFRYRDLARTPYDDYDPLLSQWEEILRMARESAPPPKEDYEYQYEGDEAEWVPEVDSDDLLLHYLMSMSEPHVQRRGRPEAPRSPSTTTAGPTSTPAPTTKTSPQLGQKEFPLLRPASENRQHFSDWAASLEDKLAKAEVQQDQKTKEGVSLTEQLDHLKGTSH